MTAKKKIVKKEKAEPKERPWTKIQMLRISNPKQWAAMVLRTLKQYDNNRTHTAQALNVSVRALRRWLVEDALLKKAPAGKQGNPHIGK
jgi:hypothetical protein